MKIYKLVSSVLKKLKCALMPKSLQSNEDIVNKFGVFECEQNKEEEYFDEDLNEIKYHISEHKKNMHFSRLEEYIDFLENELQKETCLANISIEIWNKFNSYNYSKLTREKMDEFEKLFYLVLEQFQYYFNENKISLINRWNSKKESRKFKIANDISFLIRYSENLLRYQYNYKRLLTYDKLQDIECIKVYLDSKFNEVICERVNEVILNTPNVLLDLSIEESDLTDTITLDSIRAIKSNESKMNQLKSNDTSLGDDDNIYNNKDLNQLFDDIDDFDM